jgi:hypothetical protein
MYINYENYLKIQSETLKRETHYGDVAGDGKTVLKKLRGFSPSVNYTDRATATCRRS